MYLDSGDLYTIKKSGKRRPSYQLYIDHKSSAFEFKSKGNKPVNIESFISDNDVDGLAEIYQSFDKRRRANAAKIHSYVDGNGQRIAIGDTEAFIARMNAVNNRLEECAVNMNDAAAAINRFADGLNRIDDASAYDVAISNGFTGTVEEWLTSLQGVE